MDASVEMEKIEPGVVVAQQPVVARDPGEALRRGDIGGYLGDGTSCLQPSPETGACAKTSAQTEAAEKIPEEKLEAAFKVMEEKFLEEMGLTEEDAAPAPES